MNQFNCPLEQAIAQIWISPYQLKRKSFEGKMNSQSFAYRREGCLIKIENEDGDYGFSDLCPWPDLGDLTWQEEVQQKGVIYQRSLQLAYDDLIARKEKRKLVTEQPVRNNYLLHLSSITTLENYPDHAIIKIKGDKDIHFLATFLNKYKHKNLKYRLDFNFCLTEIDFELFWSFLDDSVRYKIEYIEDPFPYDFYQWTKWKDRVQFALDWQKPENLSCKELTWDFCIGKPSRESIDQNHQVLTSALEHPVGLVHGLRFAQTQIDRVHGFLVTDIYEMESSLRSFFQIHQDQLIYQSDGYGVGFTQYLLKLNWIPHRDESNKNSNSFLLAPHRSPFDERQILFKIKNEFLKNDLSVVNDKLFLIPSSGSTQNRDESIKVYVHTKTSLENSASRVNDQFQVTEQSCWGCVLPLFHVGGLGILIRSQLAQCRFESIEWSNFSPQWIIDKKITHLSLVPTQIYEIVQKKWVAPQELQFVIIGGAALSRQLANEVCQLGWPLVETYGMTETGSMVAYKNKTNPSVYQAMKGIDLFEQEGLLNIHCNSLALYELKWSFLEKTLIVKSINSPYQTNDVVELVGQNQFEFKQRFGDVIKIKGEGVSLTELRQQLENQLQHEGVNPFSVALIAEPHDRDGHQLILLGDESCHMNKEMLESVLRSWNHQARPYEKIGTTKIIETLPRTELGKVKYSSLKFKKSEG